MNVEEKIVKILKKRELTITTAESCTGGMIASKLVSVAGVSDVFGEGFVTYSDDSKRDLLGVPKRVLKKYGAVSGYTAKYMAGGAAKRTGADVAVSVTGLAGPGGGTPDKPVGLVYIGYYYDGIIKVKKYIFKGDRQQVREKACDVALEMLLKIIQA